MFIHITIYLSNIEPKTRYICRGCRGSLDFTVEKFVKNFSTAHAWLGKAAAPQGLISITATPFLIACACADLFAALEGLGLGLCAFEPNFHGMFLQTQA